MGDTEPARIRSVLAGLGTRLGIENAVETARLWSRWRAIVGDAVADHAEPSSLRRGVLRVRTDSPAWATEVGYLADEIRSRVNATLGSKLVNEVKVWVGSEPIEWRRETPPPPPAPPVGDDPAASSDAAAARVSDDPQTALSRARQAWLARRNRGRPEAAREPLQDPRNPW